LKITLFTTVLLYLLFWYIHFWFMYVNYCTSLYNSTTIYPFTHWWTFELTQFFSITNNAALCILGCHLVLVFNKLNKLNKLNNLSMVVHSCNPSTQDTEAGRLWIWHQPELLSEFEVSLGHITRPYSKKKQIFKKLHKLSASGSHP
jgi:hypothetical protein